MKVRDLMATEVVRLPPDAPVRDAALLIEQRRISSILVERTGPDEPWGIVTRHDIVHKVVAKGLDPSKVLLSDIMSAALIVVDPALDVGYASRLMRRFGVRHLPVVQMTALAGVVSYHDVLRLFTLLSSIPFFRQLPLDDLVALLQIASVRRCADGETLMREGEDGRQIYILEEGEMSESTRQAGRIARISPGEIFGEMELFGGRRSATVRSAGPSRLLVIENDRFLELTAQRQRLAAAAYRSMSRILSERLKRANRFLFLRGIWAHKLLMLKTLGAAAAVFLLLVGATATIAEEPRLCGSCHYMRPYQASWSVSPHNKVSCTRCHVSYGIKGAMRGKITGVAMIVRYATETYAPKPNANVSDAACLQSGCHENRKFKDSDFSLAASGSLRFNHAAHLQPMPGVGSLRCTSCHNHRGQEEHFSVSMETCFLCHFPKAAAAPTPCRGCHDLGRSAPTDAPARVDHAGFGATTNCLGCHGNVTTGTGAVEDSRCTSCHLKPKPLSAAELHRTHIPATKADCFDCHATLDHRAADNPMLAGRCEACHINPHAAQEQLYLGEGGVGVPGRPALMFYRHVECTACHGAGRAGATGAAFASNSVVESSKAGAAPGTSATADGKATATRVVAGATPPNPAAPPIPHTTAGVGRRLCLDCHDMNAERQARMWKVTIAQQLAEVRQSLARFEAAAGANAASNHPEAYGIYAEARRNYEIVAADPSAGIHNFRYALDLLKAARERIGAALARLNAGKGGPR